jgi:hypothetical protein
LRTGQALDGVKNSDDVGLRLDLKAEVFVNGTNTPPVVSGEVQNVSAGGSGFANAVLHTINPASASWPVSLGAGDQLLVRISARRTCTGGGGGHTSGTVRLWYNGADIDGGPGRDAGSRLDAGIVGGGSNVYLRPGAALDDVPGSSRLPIDKALDSKARVRNAPSSPSGPGA